MSVYEESWSWSKVNSFYNGLEGEGCLFQWYNTYRKGNRGCGNFFADAGSIAHEIIEQYHKNELFAFELQEKFLAEYNNIQFRPPYKSTIEKYKNQFLDFFDAENIDKWFEDFNILESEEEFIFKIGDYKFRGFADMVAEHKQHGLCVVDIKSANKYTGSKLKHNLKQLYTYSIPVFEKYGRYPDSLVFFYPREENKIDAHKFDFNELEATKEFILDTIGKIKDFTEEEQFIPRCTQCNPSKDFYANQLCNNRFDCIYKK